MAFRIILWTLALGYGGFLLTGGKTMASPSTMITAGLLGAVLGFLLSIMFTFRRRRKQIQAGQH